MSLLELTGDRGTPTVNPAIMPEPCAALISDCRRRTARESGPGDDDFDDLDDEYVDEYDEYEEYEDYYDSDRHERTYQRPRYEEW